MTRQLPAYLKKKTIAIEPGALSDAADPYRPLVAGWLLEMALCLGWYRKRRPCRLPEIFADDDFLSVTEVRIPGKRDSDGDLETSIIEKMSDADFANCLKRRLAVVRKMPVGAELPLFKNVELLAQVLGVGEVEMAVLTFLGVLSAVQSFRIAVASRCSEVANATLFKLLASLLGRSEGEIQAALQEDAPLVATGVVKLETNRRDLENKISLMPGLDLVLLLPQINEADLVRRFLKQTEAPLLDVASFSHLAKDIEALVDYLRGVLRTDAPGCNVLFYGPPGTGKTELAKAIAAALGTDLYEIAFADAEGNPIRGAERLRAFNMCQKMLAQKSNAILMFDEIEDVFAARRPLWLLFGGGARPSGSSGKAWINRSLERNLTPAIWVTNDPDIDPAYLRRFDYSVRFPIPPQAVRLTIAHRYLGEFEPSPEWLARIAENEHVSPGQLETAAKVAALAARGDHAKSRALVDQALDRSATLLDQKRTPARVVMRTHYDLRYINADIDVVKVVARLKVYPHGTFCLFGPAGTGKSELARHFADEISKPLLVRRASDLLSMWIGETEKNIANMFAEARQQDAVLVLDEADSFLADRRGAQRSWEVTQVNELLTQIEAFDGIFVCTTNLMTNLDPASLRRFAFKVKFDYLTTDQRWAMFRRELARLGSDEQQAHTWEQPVRGLDRLTPGDFAVAARQAELWGTTPTAHELYEQLRKECEAKGESVKSIGFTA